MAVFIKNQWCFVHPHWASYYVTGGRGRDDWIFIDNDGRPIEENSERKAMQYECNEFYFLPNPEEFVYQHIADNDEWQLLARPVSLHEFQEMAYLRSSFFELKLSLRHEIRCTVSSVNGQAYVQISLPHESRSFTYRLFIESNNDYEARYGAQDLSRFVFLEQQNDIMTAEVRCPVEGRYKLDLYCNITEVKESRMEHICSYIIICEESDAIVKPFPENKKAEWGPGPDCSNIGLIPISHSGGLIEVEQGEATVVFQTIKKIEVLHTLSSDALNEDISDSSYHYFDKTKLIIKLILARSGEYVLNLYAKPYGQKGSFPSVCSYLVRNTNAASVIARLPNILKGTVGDRGLDFDICLTSPSSHIIHAPQTGEVQLKYSNPKACHLIVKMKSRTVTRNEDVDATDYLYLEQSNENVTVLVRLPYLGTYAVTVYAKMQHLADTDYTAASVCLIFCKSGVSHSLPYPNIVNGVIGENNENRHVELRLISHKSPFIEASNTGLLELKFVSSMVCDLIAKMYLRSVKYASDEEISDFLQINQGNKEIIVSLRLKYYGYYVLNLFSRRTGDDFSLALAYCCLISCQKGIWIGQSFPQITNNAVGVVVGSKFQLLLGIRLISPSFPVINAPADGEVDLIFLTSVPCDILIKITCFANSGINKYDVTDCMCYNQEEKQATVFLRFREFGTYIVQVYGKHAGKEELFDHVYTCLVFCDNGISLRQPFPKTANGKIGLAFERQNLMTRLISHPSPNIYTAEKSNILLKFITSDSCTLIVHMKLETENGEIDLTKYTKLTLIEKEANVHVKLKNSGTYILNIYAKPLDNSGSFFHAYTCFITCDSTDPDIQPFPEALSKWCSSPFNEILGPLDGTLCAECDVEFALKIQNAKEVAIINELTLQRQSLVLDKDGVWRALVRTGRAGDTLNVFAAIDSTDFSPLLKYNVIKRKSKSKFIIFFVLTSFTSTN